MSIDVLELLEQSTTHRGAWGLKQQKALMSPFWGLEVQVQGVDNGHSFRGLGGKDLFQASLLGL